jgi:MFS family permease
VNVPIGLAAAAIAPRVLPESRNEVRTSFDVAGAFSVTAGLALLVYALVDAESAGWGSTQTIGLIALALALIGAFIAIESRARHPLMPFSIFRLRTLRGANVVGLLIGMSLFSMFYFISLYMQQVLGYSALKAGVAYLPLAVGIIISAGVASQARDAPGVQARAHRRPAAHRERARVVRAGLGVRAARTSATSCSRPCWPPSASASPSCR